MLAITTTGFGVMEMISPGEEHFHVAQANGRFLHNLPSGRGARQLLDNERVSPFCDGIRVYPGLEFDVVQSSQQV